jgi:hypothetical protein
METISNTLSHILLINEPPNVPQTGLHPGVTGPEVHLGDTTLLGQYEYM